jgi:demethylspheroidene O-methyltransferase
MLAAHADAGVRPMHWREKWLGLRNRLIADPRFQRWAASSLLTRFVARRRARALFDLCAGFVYSQVLLACVRLRLFDILAEGPRSTQNLADLLTLPPDSALRLLRAAASLGLVRALPGDRYALADLGASLLGNPSVEAFIEHHSLLYDDLRDPVALLRGETKTQLSGFWPYAKDRPDQTLARVESSGNIASNDHDGQNQENPYAAYSALMARSQALVAQDILDAYPITKHRCLLDVGGGEGAFVMAAVARAPNLSFKLFDLPPVAARARSKLVAKGLLSKVEITGGSFLDDALPRGADLITLVRIVHDHDDESCLALLRAVYAALPVGGTLLLAEPMAGTPGAEPIGDAYFGFYLLAMGRGRARTPAEISRLLKVAKFDQIQVISTRRPMLANVIIGRRV